MSLTTAQAQSKLATLKGKAERAKKAQETADAKLRDRDDYALSLADKGVRYADLAAAIGITMDGVTYILRKARQRLSS